MAATKRQMNWSGVTFTPPGETPVLRTATGVTQVQIAVGGSLVKFSGDDDRFPTTVVNDFSDPSIAITSADENWIFSFPSGTRGTIAATHKDAKGASGGSITFTMINAVAESPSAGGSHRQIGSGTITFYAESADGSTNPLSFALA